MNALKLKRGNAKACLTRAVEFVASIETSTTVEMLEIRLNRVVEAWGEFSSLHYECLKHAEMNELQEFTKDFADYENKYFVAHSGLKKAIRDKKKADNSIDEESVLHNLADQAENSSKKLDSLANTCSRINLPAIVIPPFSGCYKDWPSFRDLFMGSVDNKPHLTSTQKFHYLKSFLRDDAANLVKHIPISDANYIEAWERLERRYDRVNLIVQSFVQTFLGLPSISISNVQALRKITDGADEVIRGLSALGKNNRDPWLIYLLLSKVDAETKHAWAEQVGSRDDNTITDLVEFLENRCDALESCQSLNRTTTTRSKPSNQIRAHLVKSATDNISQCPMCKRDHNLPQCPQFLEKDILTRRTLTKTLSICFNCLRPGHSSNKCRSPFRCRVCKGRHHSLVHHDDPSASLVDTPFNNPSVSSFSNQPHSPATPSTSHSSVPLVNSHSLEFSFRNQTLLPTILAKLQDNRGQLVNCRVLLDTGSQSSFVTESFVQRLGLQRTHARIPIVGLSSQAAGYTKGCVKITLVSRFNSTRLPVDAFVLSKLTSNLPSRSFDASAFVHFRKLDLDDPNFNTSSSIDILLGADKVWHILKPDQIREPQGSPIAQNTTFGWVITGELFDTKYINNPEVKQSSFHSALDVDALLQRFWELEDVPLLNTRNICNDPAEEQFRSTFSRAPDGKYIVSLLFKTPFPTFGDTLQSAVSRLRAMERRFQTNQELYRQYCKFMEEYLELGHMELIPCEDMASSSSRQFYLPHHAVFKPESSSTKLRVVFDGSVKDSLGQSLNNHLLIGPPIQRDLIGVCLRFRQYRLVFTADIVKMFRQIWVRDIESDYQRIVWRQNPKEQMQHYRLKTVTYGTASAPFLSVRVLQQIAEDYRSKYPSAASILLNDVYVDDIMTGSNTVESLLSLQSELVALLSEASLRLRKWSSNCWALLANQSPEDCEYSFVDPERSNSLVKVLGMFWNPSSDVFSFSLNLTKCCSLVTRRHLLSEISRIFDPLGFLAPSVILFKILFQKLWCSELKLGWDDPLPSELSEKWISYREQLPYFKQVRVPRNIFSSEQIVELHGFSDASSIAYAAVVYARSKSLAGDITIAIVMAKTKVAPLKPVSIPRLELCGALLLTRLLNIVKSSVNLKIQRTFAWCDSEVVLHWLSSPPRRWTTFVANRTATILEHMPRHSWRYVPSDSNPADCASRGVTPANLSNHYLWWTGPSWLSLSEEHWPESRLSPNLPECESVTKEEKASSRHVLITTLSSHIFEDLIAKISSWTRLLRIIAYCFRFVLNCQPAKYPRAVNTLTFSDISKAKISLLKCIQLKFFENEIHHLQTKNELPCKSKLLRFSAFLDNDGLVRVGGRIKNSSVSFNIKHPIIIPKYNLLSSLIITDIHHRYMHCGISETFAFVRQQYWIMGSRNTIRRIIHKCKTCFMQRKLTSTQLMGTLPSVRIEPSRPFTNTGCDYAGPLTIKLSRCRKPKLSKAYIALFVCMATKAIHLELVTDLTTDAFLAALRRFVSRRGKCTNIYSDNGTNFHGARRCLTEMHQFVSAQTHNDIISTALANDGITWHFIPPSAPHFGGLWEAGVKSVKQHLRRVVGASVLTFEELYTVLTQVEAILNSRPLCSMSDFDLNPLTPAHFLVGEPLTAVPEPSHLDAPVSRLSHWNHIQGMVQGFWKRWHSEYLTSLQERPKWQRTNTNIKEGDLVVIKEPCLPPTKWVLGRIVSVAPGTDQHVRVATVRTAAGSFVRPITKLAVLPVS